MSARTVVVVSDSHLSARTAEAVAHWDAVVDHVGAVRPDLVVHAGDVSTDGAVAPGDLAVAAGHLARVPAPLAVIPGNHDVGDGEGWAHADDAVISPANLDRYRAAFGADRFSRRVGAWWLLGVDAQLLGTGEPAEADQWAWLAAEVAAIPPGAPVGLVTHKPLVPVDGDGDRPTRYVPGEARRRVLDLLATVDLRVVVSGHVHQSLVHDRGGVRHVWVPSTWALVPDRIQPVVGVKRVGVTHLVLGDDGGVDVADVRLPGVGDVVLGDDLPSPYAEPH